MLDSQIDPPCLSSKEYHNEQVMWSYYVDAINSIERFMGGTPPSIFIDKLAKALKNKEDWAEDFVWEVELTDKEIAGLKQDSRFLLDLFQEDFFSSYCPD